MKYLIALFVAFPVLAVAAEEGGKICLDNVNEVNGLIAMGIGILVTVSSALANVVKKEGFFGKAIHYMAINLKVDK